MRSLRIIFVFLLLSTSVFAAENSKKPLKAAALSVLIPGGGQFYNESYWKFGGICFLETSLIGLTVYHHQQSQKFYDDYAVSQNPDDYKNYLKYYDKRQSDLFWLGTTVFLSALDAFVDAHLYDFKEKKKKIHLKFERKALILSYGF